MQGCGSPASPVSNQGHLPVQHLKIHLGCPVGSSSLILGKVNKTVLQDGSLLFYFKVRILEEEENEMFGARPLDPSDVEQLPMPLDLLAVFLALSSKAWKQDRPWEGSLLFICGLKIPEGQGSHPTNVAQP